MDLLPLITMRTPHVVQSEENEPKFEEHTTAMDQGWVLVGRDSVDMVLQHQESMGKQIDHPGSDMAKTPTQGQKALVKPGKIIETHHQADAMLMCESASKEVARPLRRLHHYFERSCDINPDALALQYGQLTLSYTELDHRANRLAHFLCSQHSLQPGARVGIVLQRSVELYVSLLSIIKCGATFVPIDPCVPHDRLVFVIDDAEIKLLVSTSDLADVTTHVPCEVISLDKLSQAIEHHPISRPKEDLASDALCYIIYTSGTTGRPKGVGIHQSKISNFVSVVTPLYGFQSSDRVYQGMSISFDFSIEEIWTTFAVGATLVPGPTDHRRLGPGLRQYLEENKVTLLCCVPTLLSTIDRDLPDLRTLIVGGEACPEDLVKRWSPGRVMLNTYGPTETTVTASMGRLVPNRKVTIGKPLPTYSMHLLDENEKSVPEGEIGEIFIGGIGVAEGYINRNDKTEECFLLKYDVEKGDSAVRLYRTGDLGRLTPGGEIEYCGRCDSQVKIRGHRIELAEVESVLLEHKAVESAIVNLETIGQVQELVAYVVLRRETNSTETVKNGQCTFDIDDFKVSLFNHMCSSLPRYEMPAFLEVIDAVPTLPSGKTNRKLLPPPSSRRLSACKKPVVVPATSLEAKLAEAWQTVFAVENISVQADFFEDLGGHSLVAAQLVSLLRKQAEFEDIPISDLYMYPTIRSLANHIEVGGSPEVVVQNARDANIRYSSIRVWMCGVGQLAFVYTFAQVLALPFSYLVVERGFHPFLAALLVGSYGLPAALVLPFVAKWLLIGRYRPGRYPLWGWYYLRWWISTGLVALGPLGLFTGTPWLAPYMRCLGARIGKGCYVASTRGFLQPDLIEIGNNVSIGYGCALETHAIRDGWLYLGTITIGDRAFIGNNSVVMLGARVGENAHVLEQSLVAEKQFVGHGETWTGSPSQYSGSDRVLTDMSSRPVPQKWTSREMMIYLIWMLLFFLGALPSLMIAPSASLMWFLGSGGDMVSMTLLSPIGGVIFVLSTCFWIALFKRTILYRTPEGIFPLRSSIGMRKWVTDKLMSVSLVFTNSLYATLYASPWLRAVGAKVGPRAEVSTVSYVDPDLMVLDEESFVADIAMIGAARHHHGCIFTGKTEVGIRSFVGNAALLPPGTKLADNCLLGVLSVPPTEMEKGSNWLGSPALYLPRRQESPKFNEDVTFHPTRKLIATRLTIEFFRVMLPAVLVSSFFMMGTLTVWSLVEYEYVRSFWVLAALIPGIYITAMLFMYLVIVALKWIIIGRYVPYVAPLWSHFVWRSEFITALYENAAVPGLIRMSLGTPFIGPLFRLLGAQIGSRVYLETTYITEFDLVRVKDDAMVGFSCSLQTHLFEDRVMKMSYVNLGRQTSIGAKSIVLYDSTVEEYTSVDPLSLIMKGECIPANTEWRGIPAQSITRVTVSESFPVPMGAHNLPDSKDEDESGISDISFIA